VATDGAPRGSGTGPRAADRSDGGWLAATGGFEPGERVARNVATAAITVTAPSTATAIKIGVNDPEPGCGGLGGG
jgi:hypothetical protein